MELVQCPNNHFYDGEKFSECPYCKQDIEQLKVMESYESRVTINKSMVNVEEGKTVRFYEKVIGTEPVVGWLVCTEGEYFGESFRLTSGKNFIGRASNMDIILGMDMSVSRDWHACVVYEPKSRTYFVQPGESGGLFYLNDEVVLSNMKMQAYDVLLIGSTRLMLVPCCCERFSWDDCIQKRSIPSRMDEEIVKL